MISEYAQAQLKGSWLNDYQFKISFDALVVKQIRLNKPGTIFYVELLTNSKPSLPIQDEHVPQLLLIIITLFQHGNYVVVFEY